MADKTNAQIALECATRLVGDSRNAHSATLIADQFLRWLNLNNPTDLKK